MYSESGKGMRRETVYERPSFYISKACAFNYMLKTLGKVTSLFF